MKERMFSKFLVASMILVLALIGLNTYSYATITQDTDTGTITVSGLEAGVSVTAYQLTTVNYDYTADQPQATPYTWDANVKTWVDAKYKDYSDPENFHKTVISDSDQAKAFYSDLSAAIKGGTVTPAVSTTKTAEGTATYPVTSENLQSTVQFTDCEMGTYLILIENGYRVYMPSAVNLTPEYNNNQATWELNQTVAVSVKSTTPQISKTTSDDEYRYGTNETIGFRIVADVPDYLTGSLAKNYYVSDSLSNGLTLDTTSIAVYGQNGSANPVELTATTDYELTTTSATRPNNGGNVDFVVNFVYDNIKSYDKVVITYNATLDKDATTVVGETGNTNTAYLDYSNNPYSATSWQNQENTSTVYTYGAEITKVDKNTTTTTLPGAEFTLSKDGATLYFVKTATDGVYYLANQGDGNATTNLVVDTNGKLVLNGLDVGTYSLVETKAPEGYNKSITPEEIVIADTDTDGILDGGTTGVYTLQFPNSQGFQLPVTGGIGTVIFAASGIVFIGLGIILLAIVIKKRH